MEKLKLHTLDLTKANFDKLAELFPHCVTEAANEGGKLELVIDFELLRQELSGRVADGSAERYQLNWPGKREALLAANAAISKTLRPSRDESVDFDTTRNIFIEGDNLEALKLLQEAYLNKIKLIYIDPPYNTGNDFIYSDDFSESASDFMMRSKQIDSAGQRLIINRDANGRFHSDWLSMMYPRLVIARRLLRDDGIIVISIDENEHANLKKICDEIFGSNNFCGEIVWKNSSKNDQDYISIQHEYLVVYVRDKQHNRGEWKERKQGLDDIYSAFDGFKKAHGRDWAAIHKAALEWYKSIPDSNPIKDSSHYSWMDDKGVYFPDNISGPNDGQYVYDIEHPTTSKLVKPPSRGWFCPKDKLMTLIADDRVHFGPDETTVPCLKTYLANTEYVSLTSIRFVDGRAASKRLRAIFGEKVFTNPKDEYLLAGIFKAMGVKDSDIVLDFFAGSGTTVHSVFELNKAQGSQCQVIAVQIAEDLQKMLSAATGAAKKVTKNAINFLKSSGLPETISEITKERIRRVGKSMAEYSGSMPAIDTGIRVFKVDSTNMMDVYYKPDDLQQGALFENVSNVKPDRCALDLLFQVIIDWGVEVGLPVTKETIDGKEVFFVDGNAMAACFDTSVTEDVIKHIASYKPLRAVFRDAGFSNDAVKINAEQIFKLLSPATEMKVI
ncbi:adenine-specific DNA-methyltransferase [Azospirillum lipoferum]|nr:adenine-specific DNA-methyltransferase [Azospirillum lipoferum]